MSQLRIIMGLAFLGLCALGAGSTRADIVVTNNNNAMALANAVTSGNTGVTVTSATFSGASDGAGMNSGLYSTVSPGNTYGLENFGTGSGIVLSSGLATDMHTAPAFDPAHSHAFNLPATPAQEILLKQTQLGTKSNHFDVAELTVNFNMMPGFNQVFFTLAFASAEWPNFVGSQFNDSFGLYLNGTATANNIAFIGGQPVNIDNPNMQQSPANTSLLQGVMHNPGGGFLLTFSGNVNPTNNTLIFIIGDSGDAIYDSTVWISGLGAQNLSAPEPTSMALAAIGGVMVCGFAWRRRCKAKAA